MFQSLRSFVSVISVIFSVPFFASAQTPDIMPVVVGTPELGEEYWVEVRVGTSVPVSNLFGLSLKLKSSSPNTVYIDGSAERGALMGSGVIEFFRLVDSQTVDMAVSRTSPPGVNGTGVFARARFRTTAAETVTFTLIDVDAIDAQGNAISLQANPASVTFTTTTPNPSPGLSGLSPTSGTQGQSMSVSVTGSGFVADVTTVSFGAGVSVGSFTVASPTSATAQIQISAGASAGPRNVTVTNPAPGGGSSTLSAGFTVNTAPAPVLTVSPGTISAGVSGGSQSLSVSNTGTGTLNWSTSSNQPWVTLSPNSGSGNASVTVSIAANPSSTARSATITVTASGSGNSPQTVTVSQAGATPSPILSVSPISSTFPAEGGIIDVSVTNTGTGTLNWQALVDQPWLTVSSGSGTGNATVRVTAEANASTSARSATLTIIADGAGNSPQSVQFLQEGIAISPPTVTTSDASDVGTTQATLGGDVTDDGGSTVSERGVCYYTSPSPLVGGTCSVAPLTGVGAFSVTVSGLSQNTQYFARAFATNQAGTAYGSDVTFTTQGTANPVPTVTSVNPEATIHGASVQVTITGSNFAASGLNVQASSGVSVSNVNRVSSTSITAQFSVAAGASLGSRPVVVTNPSPGGGASNSNVSFAVTLPPPNPSGTTWTPGVTVPTSPQPTFEWAPVNGASNYSVQVSNQNTFPQKVTCVGDCESSTNNTFTNTYSVTGTTLRLPSALMSGTVYFWRVRSNTNTVPGVWSPSYSFTVTLPPSVPVLVAPDNGATGLQGSVQLVWTPTAATRNYEIQVSDDVSFASKLITTDTLTVSRFRMPSFQAGSPNDYFWRVRSIGQGDNPSAWSDVRFFRRAALTSDGGDNAELPTEFKLMQNYPNPFNPSTTITYSMPESGWIQMRLYSVTGSLLKTLTDGHKNAGIHQYVLDASGLPSGVYLVQLQGEKIIKSMRITLVK